MQGTLEAVGCPPDVLWLSTSHYRAVSRHGALVAPVRVMPGLEVFKPNKTEDAESFKH